MPFTKKYLNTKTTTVRVRIPEEYLGHIKNILQKYDEICGTKGEDFVYKIQQKIEDGLNSI